MRGVDQWWKAVCARITKHLVEWKKSWNYIRKLTSKGEPMLELNQILTQRSVLIFFDRHLKWKTAKERVLCITQCHGYLLLWAITESSFHSYGKWKLFFFFSLLSSLGSHLQRKDCEIFLSYKGDVYRITGLSRLGET